MIVPLGIAFPYHEIREAIPIFPGAFLYTVPEVFIGKGRIRRVKRTIGH